MLNRVLRACGAIAIGAVGISLLAKCTEQLLIAMGVERPMSVDQLKDRLREGIF